MKTPKIERVVNSIGSILYYKDGKLHRDDGPAVIHPDGSEKWIRDDNFHREDGPAIIHPSGYERWFMDGERWSNVL